MTGGLIEKMLEYLANKLDATYVVVASINREYIERKLKLLKINHFLNILKNEDKREGSLYVLKDDKWVKTTPKKVAEL